jgi:hypothetical protein
MLPSVYFAVAFEWLFQLLEHTINGDTSCGMHRRSGRQPHAAAGISTALCEDAGGTLPAFGPQAGTLMHGNLDNGE